MASNLGRENSDFKWAPGLWDRIDQAVNKEGERIRIARRFIPWVPMPEVPNAPTDTISYAGDVTTNLDLLKVHQGTTVPLIEIWVEFALTAEQINAEEQLATAVTLATRATNLLAQAEDLLIFQGEPTRKTSPIFKNRVGFKDGPPGPGLLKGTDPNDDIKPSLPGRYGENTFTAVTAAYSSLQRRGHYGPYALVFHSDIYADTYAPLEKTLIMPADRIKPLMEKGFFGTGTLPESRGLLFSLGGNTIDLVIGQDAITAYTRLDNQGLYRFRVFERFAVRDKDDTGRVELGFKPNGRAPDYEDG